MPANSDYGHKFSNGYFYEYRDHYRQHPLEFKHAWVALWFDLGARMVGVPVNRASRPVKRQIERIADEEFAAQGHGKRKASAVLSLALIC